MGYANVDVMLRSMTSTQLQEWMVFNTLEPFTDERQDQRVGALIATISNAHRNSKKRSRPFSVAECTPLFGDAVSQAAGKKKTWQEMKAMGQLIAAAHNADFEDRRRRK